MATIRQQRVSNLLFQELSILVGHELSDPRLSLVNVTGVEISRDLRNAKVFVFHSDDELSQQDVLDALDHATPFLRSQVAERCGLRMVPELLFCYDDMPSKAARVDELLQQIAQERAGEHSDGQTGQEEAENEAT